MVAAGRENNSTRTVNGTGNTAEKQLLKSKTAGCGRPVLKTPRLGKIMVLSGVNFFVGIISKWGILLVFQK